MKILIIILMLMSISNVFAFDENGKSLDGVLIKAVEKYPNPRNRELNIGVTLYPYNAYYNGFGINGSFTYYFGKIWAWDIFNGTMFYPVDNSLTATLAEDFGVEPERIERIKFLFSSNLKYVHTYGKLVFLEQYIKYYRSSVIFGAGAAATNLGNYITANIGLDLNFYVNDNLSLKFEVCDSLAVNGSSFASPNYVVLKFITGLSF